MARKTKNKVNVVEGIFHIKSTFNNTLITVTDLKGNTIYSSSGGKGGFKGSRRSTPFAAQVAAQNCTKVAQEEYGMKEVSVYVQGPGPGRESAMRAIGGSELVVRDILDKTPLPHNGCRPPKKRRI